MNKFIKYLLITFQVGGGFAGLVVTFVSLGTMQNVPKNMMIMGIVGYFFFFFGIISGLALVDNIRLGIILSAIYQALQIILIRTSFLSYNFLVQLQKSW